jgi:outer membrane protein assembly factor BamB
VPGEGRGKPAADVSSAYFLGRRHEVIAVNARSGAIRWRSPTGEPGESTLGFRVVAAGRAIVAGDYNLFAFDAQTGTRLWQFEPKDGGYSPGTYLGTAAYGLVFSGARGGRLYALERETGLVRWSASVINAGVGVGADARSDLGATVFEPVVGDEEVAAAYTLFTSPNGGGVILLDARTGSVRWKVPFPTAADPQTHTNAAGGPVLTDTLVIATSGDGVIHAFERATGAHRWRIPPLDALARRGVSTDSRPLAVTGRTLYAGSLTGIVTAYDLPSQRAKWEYQGNSGSIAFTLVSDEQSVYIPHVGGRLIALAAGTGVERWRIGDLRFGFVWPPMAFGNHLYFAGTAAGFFAIAR